MATRDFRSQQIRTTQIIASGSDTASKPSLLIYSSSAASNDQGSVDASLLSSAGEDAWMFVSGSTTAADGEQVLFGGNIVVSGTISGSTFSSLPSADIIFNASDDIIFNSANTEYFQIKNDTQKEVVVNDASNDIDFRVESNSMQSAIHVNANQDLVVIGRDGAPIDLTSATSPAVGTDVKVLIDGLANSKDGTSRGSTLVAGDLVVSGTLYAERQVMEVDLSQTGNLIMTGAVHFDNIGAAPGSSGQTTIAVPANDGALFVSTGSLRFRTTLDGSNFVETNVGAQYVDGLGLSGSSAGSTTTFTTDNSIVAHLTGSEFSGPVGVTGSFGVVGSVSLAQGNSIFLNGLEGDVKITATSEDRLEIDGDDTVFIAADSDIQLDVANNTMIMTSDTFEINAIRADVDFEVNTDDYYATFFVDGGDNTIILGAETFDSSPTASELLSKGYTSDVKILLSGSAGTKDSSTRGVVVATGDMVISGTLYGATGVQYIKDADEGLKNTSGVAQLDLNSMTTSGTVAVGDSFAFIDADGSNNTKKGTVADLVTAIAGDGLTNSSNQLQVGVDGSTIERSGDALRVKDDGITAAKINSDIAGSGLEQHTDGSIRIAAAAAGDGLIGGEGAALAVNVGPGIKIGTGGDADKIIVDDAIVATVSGSTFTGQVNFDAAITGSADIHIGGSVIHKDDVDTNISFTQDAMTFNVGNINALKLIEDATNSEVVVNDGSDANLDFRVETNNKTHAIHVAAANDTVLIHSSSYAEGAHVSFYVSGSTGLDTLSHGGITVFSGDVVVSGSLVDGNHKKIALLSIAENGTFTTPPNASGTNAVAIGNKSVASGNNSIALGTSETNTTEATGIHSAAIGGDDATASGDYSIVAGGFGNTASGDYSAVMGRSSTVSGENSIALGKSLSVPENDSIAIGNNTNNAKVAISGSIEVFSNAIFSGSITIAESNDLLIPAYIKHVSDTNTSVQFDTDRIRLNTDGASKLDISPTQVLVLAGAATADGTDVAFFVSGSKNSKDTTERGTALFDGDVHISGALSGPSEYNLTDSTLRIFRDGNVMKFDDGENTVKTLSDLASIGASTDHFVGVHGDSPQTSKLKATGSVAFAGSDDGFVDGLAAQGVGQDVFVYFSGSIGARAGHAAAGANQFKTDGRAVTLFGGDSVFSGSANYLGNTSFTDLSATGDVTAGGSFIADGNLIKNSNGDKNIKFSSSNPYNLLADASIIDSISAQSNLHIEKDSNTQAATSNVLSDFGIVLRNDSVQTNAFAGMAFDVSTETDADSIGAAIRAERDTSASTTAANHDANLTFSTNDAGDGGLTERMRITHDGKVGIGVETPGYSLDISGDIMVRGDDIRDSGGNVAISFDGSGAIDNSITFSGAGIPTFSGNNGVKFANDLIHDGDTDTKIRFFEDEISFEAGGIAFLRLDETTQNQVVFNESSGDIDFRVESNNEDHMFFVDGGTDRIGMGINAPSTTLEIKGAIADETAVQLKDSQSSDVIIKMYHANGEDDGIIDLYSNNVVTSRINANGLSMLGGDGTAEPGLLIVRRDSTTVTDNLLGGIGFDSSDGNVPGTILNASAFIAGYAAESHEATDKGGYLVIGTSAINDDDDTPATEQLRVGSDGLITLAGNLQVDGNEIIGTALKLDSSGDITLSADGDQIIMDDGTTTRFTFNVDSTPELDVTGNFILDGSGTITLDADGGTITFADNGVSMGAITSAGYSGNAASADTIDTTATSTDSTHYLTFVDASTSTSGETLRVDPGITYNPSTNDLTVSGYFEASSGIKKSTSVKAAGYSTSTNQWVKLASATNVDSDDTLHTVFLVTLSGFEISTSTDGDASFEVSVKFSGDNASPYYNEEGTYITVDATNADNLNGFDPTTDIAITFDNTTTPSQVDLYIKSIENYKDAFATIIAGTNVDGNTVDPGFEILSGQSYAASITSLGQIIYGKWASKVFDSLTAESASLPGSTIGITVSNPTANGLYAVTTTENFISDTSPSTGKARVTFVAPASGNVEINYQSGLLVNDNLAAILYLGLSTDGTTFGNGDVAGTQNTVYDVDTNRTGAKVTIHHKWVLTGLTSGTSYTYYIGADASNSTTFSIVWGDSDNDLYYPPLIVEARALPSITTM